MPKARAGVDWCSYCDVFPRHPCQNEAEAYECPNASSVMKEHYRKNLPGYSEDEANALEEYRRRYGRLR